MIHQRHSKIGWCRCYANIIIAKKKDQFLANLKNYLRIEVREKAAEYLAAPEDADLLIVQKAATTSPTALVGKDAEPIVLLCYHAVFIPMI